MLNRSVSPQELGARIAEARKGRNLSQDEVSRRLGISRPTLIAVEKGNRTPKPDEIIKMAEIFGRQVHDLVSSTALVADFMPQFRVTQSAEISGAALIDARDQFKRICEDYITLERMFEESSSRQQYPEMYSIERLSVTSAAEDIAEQERYRLNLGQGPIPNLLDIMESEVGLKVFVLPISEFRIAGMFYFAEQLGGCILINGTHPVTRQRYSLAHEFAHFLVDRHREDVAILLDSGRKPRGEQFADAFAASFLMPASGLRQRFRRIVQNRNDFKVSDLCLLAEQYGVSVEAMTHRLEDLQCVRRGMWDSLSQKVTLSQVRSTMGITSQRPESRRLPQRYQRLAVEALNEAKISETRLMHFLRCNRVEARETVEYLTQTEEIASSGEWYQLSLNFADVVPVDSSERD